jgi:hypothetical protein
MVGALPSSSPFSCRRPTLYIPKDLDQLHHFSFSEHTRDAEGIEIGKRRFIKQSWIHHAAGGEMVDYHVDEFMLVRRQLAPLAEAV